MELEKLRAFSEKYLPSKKFIYLIGGVAGVVLISFLISNYIGYRKIFNAKPPVSSEGTISDVVGRDSNNNAIPDWEESLWGLDPNGDGVANKKIIDKKEAAANIKPNGEVTPSSPTDTFSQQILSTVIALHQSGSLTPQVIANVAASVGDSLDEKHTSSKTYSMNDIVLSQKGPAGAKAAYKTALKGVIDQYSDVDLGGETSIIASGLGDGGQDALDQLEPIAQAYTAMSKQIIKLSTPAAVKQNALDLANATAQMGAALLQIKNIYTDALVGMVGVEDYTKASALSDAATKTLAVYFAQ